MKKAFTLGIGVTLKSDYELDEHTVIRPYSLTVNHLELMGLTQTKREYGFICALADFISFEIESKGPDEEKAAVLDWNNQWALALLSVIIKKPITWPVRRVIDEKSGKENFTLKNLFFCNFRCEQPHILKKKELDTLKVLYPKFYGLMENKRFVRAASIAATHFHEPKIDIRIASIWAGIEALIGVDQELRHRIALFASRFLETSLKKEKKNFNSLKNYMIKDPNVCMVTA